MTDKEKLIKIKSLADKMYDAAFIMTTDASLLRKAMKEYHQFIIHEYHKEEPVSEDTMTIRKEWFEHCKESWYNEGYIDGKYNRDRQFKEPISEELEEAASSFARKDSEGISNPANFYYTVADKTRIFKAGAQWQKAKLMANATEVTVHIDAGSYPYIPQIELYDYDKDIPLAKEGDRYKVILIKEN